MRDDGIWARVRWTPLQRGRACEGAEIRASFAHHDPRRNCFNGAAPVRARKSASTKAKTADSSKLQRGRACEGAEIQRPPAGGGGGLFRFNGAAPVRARKSKRMMSSGRGSNGFNGAAPVRARKYERHRRFLTAKWALQRGRACEGAEMGRQTRKTT